MDITKVLTQNSHIARLNRYLPFDSSHDQIYEEHASAKDAIDFETVALKYILDACMSGATAIILTGDAGHGKTHLCRRLIEIYSGYSSDEEQKSNTSRSLLNTHCDGLTDIPPRDKNKKPLRIFKDFSEVTIDIAADRLEKALENNGVITVVCANEGRLRASLSGEKSGERSKKILNRFESSFDDGLCSTDGKTHIVNLNYQSIAAESVDDSLLKKAMKNWMHGTRWTTCANCESSPNCPIYHNQKLIHHSNELGNTRLEQLNLLFKTLERTDAVITIRDMLMMAAYLITGGLSCSDVHERVGTTKKIGWARQFAFYNLLFEKPDNLSPGQISAIPILKSLHKIDPGLRASRTTDDELINSTALFPKSQLDLLFPSASDNSSEGSYIDASDGIDQILVTPTTKLERKREAEISRSIVRSLRRRAFFDAIGFKNNPMKKLGFQYGDQFSMVVSGTVTIKELAVLKSKIVAGLHHIQGLQIFSQEYQLKLVDPAFSTTGADAAILSGTVPPVHIKLIPLEDKWDADENSYLITKSVDWIERSLVLAIDSGNEIHSLTMDLTMFDCLMRASNGHVPAKFYEHDIRKFTNFLGKIAQSVETSSDAIEILVDEKGYSVSLDNGMVYVSGAGG